MEIEYSVDGKKFKDYGVYVSASSGLLGGLKPKSRVQMEWADENGYCIDEGADVSFSARSIALTCFLLASDISDGVGKINAFMSLFYTCGTKHLNVAIGSKSLSYDVVLTDKVDIQKIFRDGKMVMTFALKLEEPNPVF